MKQTGYDFDTSRPAFEEAKTRTDVTRQAVFQAIRALKVCTNLQIAQHLGWSINSVTPRTNELVKRGLVESAFKGCDPITGRKVNFWKEKPVIAAGTPLELFV